MIVEIGNMTRQTAGDSSNDNKPSWSNEPLIFHIDEKHEDIRLYFWDEARNDENEDPDYFMGRAGHETSKITIDGALKQKIDFYQ